MSEPRRLWVRFRCVDPERRTAYREAVGEAGATAGQLGAHFWGFEADGGDGTFVEFLEGASDAVLTRLDELVSPALSVAGGATRDDVVPGVDVLRCTELRDSMWRWERQSCGRGAT